MRVAIFFDGANFYSGWADSTGRRKIRFDVMADWLVRRAGGTRLWGAYYYTGVEAFPAADRQDHDQAAPGEGLDRFLDNLEYLPGFFVKRFQKKTRSRICPACGKEMRFTQEKEVDTTMVAEMLGLAAVGAFDSCVLVSGDTDLCPAVEGVRGLGKQAYVATWGRADLSQRLRRAAFDHIDLLDGIEVFALDRSPDAAVPPCTTPSAARDQSPRPAPADEDEPGPMTDEESFLFELRRASNRFASGYVGVNMFLTRWESPRLDPDEDARRDVMDRLLGEGRIEIYAAPDGTRALRLKQ